MAEFILFMHKDGACDDNAWEPYLHELQQSGMFEGGSEIGDGFCARKQGQAPGITEHLGGYIRINAATTFGHGCPAAPPQGVSST